MLKQEQILVPASSATFKELIRSEFTGVDGSVVVRSALHYGEVNCPFCSTPNVIAGPNSGVGAAWLYRHCKHSQGIAAGHGCDITILFKGVK